MKTITALSLLTSLLFVPSAWAHKCPKGSTLETKPVSDIFGGAAGRLESCRDADGKAHGKAVRWRKNGQKKSETYFVQGKEHGKRTEWHENGEKRSETHYVQGKKHGKETSWHDSGQRFWETHYVQGKEHGKRTEWGKNGKKGEELHYRQGNRHGKLIYWGEGGQKVLEATYKDDVLRECRSWDESGKDDRGAICAWLQRMEKKRRTPASG